jgi:hypothetical protein
MIYNESYIPMIEKYHPCLGKSVFEALKEFTDHVLPIFNLIDRTGESVYQEDVPLFLVRHGQLEESYFSLKWLPLPDSEGSIGGYYESIHETTSRIILDRKLSTLCVSP